MAIYSGFSHIKMVIFHSYVKLPEGNPVELHLMDVNGPPRCWSFTTSVSPGWTRLEQGPEIWRGWALVPQVDLRREAIKNQKLRDAQKHLEWICDPPGPKKAPVFQQRSVKSPQIRQVSEETKSWDSWDLFWLVCSPWKILVDWVIVPFLWLERKQDLKPHQPPPYLWYYSQSVHICCGSTPGKLRQKPVCLQYSNT